jgi:DNA-binding CsgD family transcriptional regulator
MEVGMMDRTNEELTRLSNLIGLIYEGATDPGRWTEDIMPAMAQYIQVPDCILFTPLHTPKDGGYAFMYGRSPEQHDRYTRTHQHEDPYIKVALERNLLVEGNVILGDEVVPRQQWLESAIYKECYSSHPNLGQMMTSIVFGLDSTTVMPVACTFFRGLHHSNFNGQDRARLQLLLPHISRSLGVMQRLRSAELTVATSLAALDRLPSGVLLLDASGTVAFANRSAQHMLEEGDGLRLRKLSHATGLGDLVAERVSDSRAISDAISATVSGDPYAAAHFSQSVTVPRTSGAASYTLQFSALGDHNEFAGGSSAYAAIVFIADGAKEIHVDPAALQRAYGLTLAEARVAIAMLEHVSAKEVADVLEVSPHTVRTQIKKVYAKLGVDTRTRFVKLMLGLASQRA